MATVTARTLPWYAPPRVARAMRRGQAVPAGASGHPHVPPGDSRRVWRRWSRRYDPLKGSLAKRLKPPVWQQGGSIDHPLGTDKLGRDILSRMIHGARVSLAVSLVAIFVGGGIGTAMGLMSGYFGGRVDALIMRLVDISLSLPTILLALVLVAAVGPQLRDGDHRPGGAPVGALCPAGPRARPSASRSATSSPGRGWPGRPTPASWPATSSPTSSTRWSSWPRCRWATSSCSSPR